MKRYLILLVAILLLIGGVQANTRLDFQNAQDFIEQVTCYNTCSWSQSGTGENSEISTICSGSDRGGEMQSSQNPSPMTYSAATCYAGETLNAYAIFYDSTNTIFPPAYDQIGGNMGTSGVPTRLEVKILADTATIYADGVEKFHVHGLTQNPSYIRWKCYSLFMTTCSGSSWIDDTVWGSSATHTENSTDKYIFGGPENGYFLMKDILNPATSGFYRVNTTVANGTPTLIYSNSFTTTFSKGNGWNETVHLEQWGGAVYQIQGTGTAYTGTNTWNLTDFFSEGRAAPYGLYVTTIDGSLATSETIPYIGSGAYIQFDKTTYAVGETAIATVEMSDGYYDTDVYSYHVIIQDIYGTEVTDEDITISAASPHIGSIQYTWTADNDNGLYYGLIYATRLADDEEILMNYDTCELSGQLVINGFVKDAETTNGITTATVNITQGVTTDSVSSGYDGNYTTTSLAFVSDALTTIVASAPGYETYQHQFTPLRAGVIEINLTLMPLNPTYYGIALGGIARSPPYNRTVDSATVQIQNASAPYGNYTVTTNSAGYYIKDYMPNSYWWTIWGSKTDYQNSTLYHKLVTGS